MILRQNGVKQDAKQRASKNEREHDQADDDRTYDRPRSSLDSRPSLFCHLINSSAAACRKDSAIIGAPPRSDDLRSESGAADGNADYAVSDSLSFFGCDSLSEIRNRRLITDCDH